MSSLLLLFAPCQAYAWISCLRVAPNHAPAYILRAIPRLSVLQGRTTHGNDCEKPAPSSCALLSHTRGPKNAAYKGGLCAVYKGGIVAAVCHGLLTLVHQVAIRWRINRFGRRVHFSLIEELDKRINMFVAVTEELDK